MKFPETPDLDADEVIQARLGRLKNGCVLSSLSMLSDPNFERTIVLIAIYNKDGAYGMVLNRPSHMPLCEMFDGFCGIRQNREIYVGGPVQQDALQIVQITDTPKEGAHCIADRVYMGGQWADISALLDADEENSRIFLGYSGWAPGQLENEIGQGAWEVYNVNIEKLLAAPQGMLVGNTGEIEEFLKNLN